MALEFVAAPEGQELTKDSLENTFKAIADWSRTIDKHFSHLEGHIGQLTKRPAVIVKPNSKMFLLVACGTSAYFGYKLADKRFREKLKAASEETLAKAKRSYEESVENLKNQAKSSTEEQPGSTTNPYSN